MLHRRAFVSGLAIAPLTACAGSTASPHPIDDEGFIAINGIEQWIGVRGASTDAPLMFYLHGGPGEAMSPFRSVFSAWEQHVTLALWDQRGAGKTFGRTRLAQGEISLEQLKRDAIEIAHHLRNRYGKDKIILAGQSWGSVLGWSVVQERPDLFSAYVGTGQSVNWARALLWREAFARAQVDTSQDTAALAALNAAQALPLTDMARANSTRRWMMSDADMAFIDLQRRTVGNPPPQTGDLADWVEGFGVSADALTPAVLAFDIYASGARSSVPVLLIQGRDDRITPTPVVEEWLAGLIAPSKHIATIEGGHFACYTNPESFAAGLSRLIVRLAD